MKKTSKKTKVEKPVNTVEKIKVDVSKKKPITRVEVSIKDIEKKPSVYFDKVVEAKQYAKNELIMIKDEMAWMEYSERMWKITNYV